MQQLDRLVRAAMDSFDAVAPGAFYGSATGLALGAGLIYSDVPVAFYNRSESSFQILDVIALVLTHECDVANERAFNDHVVVCPILPLEDYVEEAVQAQSYDHAFNLVRDIAGNRVNRVFFLPPTTSTVGGSPILPYGGLAYLNRLASVDVIHFEEARAECAFSTYALERFDRKLTNHLLRPKSDRLPFLRG